MGELVLLPSSELIAAAEAARGFVAASKAPATVRAYESDWRHFDEWCGRVGLQSHPAQPETIATYFAALASDGRKYSTIERRATAIGERHKMGGDASPTAHPLVKATLAGIARSHGSAPVKKSALTVDVLRTVLTKIGTEKLEDKRDRALILLGFAAALRRSELVALDVDDIARHPKGIAITVRRSKTDQEGRGLIKVIPHGRRLKIIQTLDGWLAASTITEGALFRGFRSGRLLHARLAPQAVARIVQRRARAAGLDPSLFAGHSLRSGYITTAADTGADLNKIRTHAGHAKLDTTLSYVQVADAFKDHSGERFL